MTRAMFMAVLYRMDINAQASSCNSGFTDVPENAYYASAVTWAAENGIASGTSATTFEPNAAVTREQIVTLLYNYAKYQGMDTTAYVNCFFNTFQTKGLLQRVGGCFNRTASAAIPHGSSSCERCLQASQDETPPPYEKP